VEPRAAWRNPGYGTGQIHRESPAGTTPVTENIICISGVSSVSPAGTTPGQPRVEPRAAWRNPGYGNGQIHRASPAGTTPVTENIICIWRCFVSKSRRDDPKSAPGGASRSVAQPGGTGPDKYIAKVPQGRPQVSPGWSLAQRGATRGTGPDKYIAQVPQGRRP
jgi:hypothetical protein